MVGRLCAGDSLIDQSQRKAHLHKAHTGKQHGSILRRFGVGTGCVDLELWSGVLFCRVGGFFLDGVCISLEPGVRGILRIPEQGRALYGQLQLGHLLVWGAHPIPDRSFRRW